MNTQTQTHTHAGRKTNTGYKHRGRLYGHDIDVAGQWHAVNRDRSLPASGGYRSVCGEVVYDNGGHDEMGYDVARNVLPADRQPVTCQRCLKRLAKMSE